MLKADTFIEKAAAKENSRATVVFAVTTYKKSKKKKKKLTGFRLSKPKYGFSFVSCVLAHNRLCKISIKNTKIIVVRW